MNNLPEILATELLRTHSEWLLTEVAKVLVQKLLGDTTSPKTLPARVAENSEPTGSIPRRRRPGRPRGTRRPWSPERIARHRAKQERGAQMLASPQVQAMTDAIWKASGKERLQSITRMSGVSQGDGSEKPKVIVSGES